MALRGRPPTPTAILKLRKSEYAKSRPDEPLPPTKAPRCPSWLDVDAKKKWKQIVPKLLKMGCLSDIDGDALANYCQTWSRWKDAEQFIQNHGHVYPIKDDEGKTKYLQQVPQVAIARTLLQILNHYQQQFGMTPASRRNVNVVPGNRADPVKEFFSRGTGS